MSQLLIAAQYSIRIGKPFYSKKKRHCFLFTLYIQWNSFKNMDIIGYNSLTFLNIDNSHQKLMQNLAQMHVYKRLFRCFSHSLLRWPKRLQYVQAGYQTRYIFRREMRYSGKNAKKSGGKISVPNRTTGQVNTSQSFGFKGFSWKC